jgi:F0F1-type ATP synthase membrane subunit b/b'
MPSFEQDLSETTKTTTVGDVDSESADPITAQKTPSAAAARMLELAGTTADRLVIEAQAEAQSLVTGAQAEAGAILEASRNEAIQVAAECARTKEEQAAELDRERVTALAELRDEKSALEAQIAKLRQVESDHRSLMRRHLTEQLSMLDATLPDPPATSPG